MRSLGLAIAITLVGWAYAQEEPQLPTRMNHVSDYAQILKEKEKEDLDSLLKKVKQDTGVEILVLTVLTTNPLPINEYGQRISQAWDLGKEDPKRKALLFLVAVDDGLVRLIVSKGLEKTLTDERLNQILKGHIIPAFERGNYAQGIISAINQVLQILAEEPERPGLISEDVLGVMLGLALVALIVLLVYLIT